MSQKPVQMRPNPIPPERRSHGPHLRVVSGGGERDEPGSSPPAAPPDGRGDGDARFRAIYETWFDEVVKWLYALGAPASDTEDLAQEIFVVVRRKLARFDGGNPAGWLYRIAQLTVRDHRRRAWFRHLVLRRQSVDLAQLPHAAENQAHSYEQAENRRLLQKLVGKMSEKLRTTFVLFEIEGYSGEEIARIQDIPLGTVWTRLHHARKDFWRIVKDARRRGGEDR
jgi:RNA polymerase sigma-70 factor (ECF subfamily)